MMHHSNDNNNNDDDDYYDENVKVALRLDSNLSEIDALLLLRSDAKMYKNVVLLFSLRKGKKNDLRIYILSVRLFNSADEFIIVGHCFIGIIIRNDVYYNFFFK